MIIKARYKGEPHPAYTRGAWYLLQTNFARDWSRVIFGTPKVTTVRMKQLKRGLKPIEGSQIRFDTFSDFLQSWSEISYQEA